MSFTPTHQQQEVVQTAIQGHSMKLGAFAGTGKTSTLQLIANAFLQQGRRGIYLAFNKAIADEATLKMPSNVYSSTFHALAFQSSPNWIRHKVGLPALFPKRFAEMYGLQLLKVQFNRIHFRSKKFFISRGNLSINTQKYLIDKALTHFMKSSASEPQPRHVIEILKESDIHHLDYDRVAEYLFPIMCRVWSDYCNPEVMINIPHDCYLKLWAMTQPVINADFILFDEAQDADPIMYQILVNQPCQVIYTGDQYQQIYAWRGAINMMQRLDNLQLPTKHITQSFRFGQALADYVNPILHYLGSELPIVGLDSLQTHIDTTDSTVVDVDAVLTRTNLTAVSVLLNFFEKGKIGLAQNVDFNEVLKLINAIDEFKNDQSRGNNHHLLRWFGNYEELLKFREEYPNDRIILPSLNLYENFGLDKLTAIIKTCQDAELTGNYDFIVTTAHRAKGLEFDKVLLMDDFQTQFSQDGVINEQSVQATDSEEFRLLYVAITRTKKVLYARHVQPILDVIEQLNSPHHIIY